MPKPVLYITASILFLGAFPLPYGYYTLLRIVAFAVFSWAAYITFDNKEELFPWLLVILAILFNPIIKVYLPKEVWMVIDTCSGLVLIIFSKRITVNENKNTIERQ